MPGLVGRQQLGPEEVLVGGLKGPLFGGAPAALASPASWPAAAAAAAAGELEFVTGPARERVDRFTRLAPRNVAVAPTKLPQRRRGGGGKTKLAASKAAAREGPGFGALADLCKGLFDQGRPDPAAPRPGKGELAQGPPPKAGGAASAAREPIVHDHVLPPAAAAEAHDVGAVAGDSRALGPRGGVQVETALN